MDPSHPWQIGPPRGTWMGNDRDVRHRGGPVSVHVLPIDVAGSMKRQVWLGLRSVADTQAARNTVRGGVGTGKGWSWGSLRGQSPSGT